MSYEPIQHKNEFNSILTILKGSNIPKTIISSYENLVTLIEQDEIYGALFKIKDTFELVIKLPLIIVLSEIINKVYQKDDAKSDFVTEFNSLHKILKELIHDAVSYQLTLGNWVTIAGDIKKVNVDALFENLPSSDILTTLHIISQKNHEACNSNKYGESIVAWRNKTIGHGALNCNKEEVKEEILTKLDLLNTLLLDTLEDYAKIIISIENNLISIKSTQNSTEITVNPFISLIQYETNEDNYELNENRQSDYLGIFDSYNGKKRISHIINYANGKKLQSYELTKTLNYINTNLEDSPTLSLIESRNMGYVNDDTIFTADTEILNALQSATFYQGSYFSDWFINCTENHSGGVFLCCAERGMGKSAFTRVVDQIDDIKIKDNKKLKTFLENNPNLLIRTFHFNSYYNSDIFTFISRLKDIFTSELVTKDKVKSLENITYISHSIEKRYVSLYNSLTNDDISTTDKKALFLDFLKTLLYIWKQRYQKEKLILVLDGIDEITSGTNKINISDWIPTPEEFNDKNMEDIYFFITSRCTEEVSSNPELIRFLNSGIFDDVLTIKRETEGFNYDSAYSRTFINNIQNELSKNTDGKAAKLSREEAIHLSNLLDWRFNYLTAYKKVYYACSEEDLKNFASDPFEAYIKNLDKLSKSYSKDIQFILNLLAMTSEALTINEISYLLTGDNRPTFKTYGMLMDISNFLTIERDVRRGTLYNLTHPDWLEKIKSNTTLQNSKNLLISDLTNLFNDLIKDDISTIPFSLPNFDGETWLVSNLYVTDSNVINSNLSISNSLSIITLGENLYQIKRNIILHEKLLKVYQAIGLMNLDAPSFNSYIYNCANLLDSYSTINDSQNRQRVYDLLTDICIIMSNNELYNDSVYISARYHAYDCLRKYLTSTNPEKALEFFNNTIAILEKLASDYTKSGEFFNHSYLAAFYGYFARFLSKIDPEKAGDLYATGTDIFVKLANDNINGDKFANFCNLIASYREFAEHLEYNSSYQFTYEVYDEAVSTVEKHKLDENFLYLSRLIKLYGAFALFLNKTNPQKSMALFNKAISYCKQLENNPLIARENPAESYSFLADRIKSINPEKATELYDNAISIYEQLANDYRNGGNFFDLKLLAHSYRCLAIILEQNNRKKATELYDNAISIYERLANDYINGGLFFDINCLSDCYHTYAKFLLLTDLKKSSILFNKAISIYEQSANDYRNGGNFFDLKLLAHEYICVAAVTKQTNTAKITAYFNKAISIYEQLADDYRNGGNFFDLKLLADTYFNYALFLKPDNNEESKNFFNKAISIYEQLFNDLVNGYNSFVLKLLWSFMKFITRHKSKSAPMEVTIMYHYFFYNWKNRNSSDSQNISIRDFVSYLKNFNQGTKKTQT